MTKAAMATYTASRPRRNMTSMSATRATGNAMNTAMPTFTMAKARVGQSRFEERPRAAT